MKVEFFYKTIAADDDWKYHNTITSNFCDEDLEFEACNIAEENNFQNCTLFLKLICENISYYYRVDIHCQMEPMYFVKEIEKYEQKD